MYRPIHVMFVLLYVRTGGRVCAWCERLLRKVRPYLRFFASLSFFRSSSISVFSSSSEVVICRRVAAPLVPGQKEMFLSAAANGTNPLSLQRVRQTDSEDCG